MKFLNERVDKNMLWWLVVFSFIKNYFSLREMLLLKENKKYVIAYPVLISKAFIV